MNLSYQLPILNGEPLAVHRMICIGRNYPDHVREMGGDPTRKPPIFFFKPLTALNTSGALRYPSFTQDLHHEIELVVAISTAGAAVSEAEAEQMVGGFAVGLDMTCRDLQRNAKDDGGPWDLSKGFDGSAPCSALQAGTCNDLQSLGDLHLTRNGKTVQSGTIKDMIWSVPELISRISHFICLYPGDLIFTGTPAGVGPVAVGDTLVANIAGLEPQLEVQIIG